MKQVVTVPSSTGAEIMIEMEAGYAFPTVQGVGPPMLAARATRTFEESVHRIAPVAGGVVAQLRQTAEGVPEVAVKSGPEFTAEVLVAAVGGGATFDVGLAWTNPARE